MSIFAISRGYYQLMYNSYKRKLLQAVFISQQQLATEQTKKIFSLKALSNTFFLIKMGSFSRIAKIFLLVILGFACGAQSTTESADRHLLRLFRGIEAQERFFVST